MMKKNYYWISIFGHVFIVLTASLMYLQNNKTGQFSHHFLPAFFYHPPAIQFPEKKEIPINKLKSIPIKKKNVNQTSQPKFAQPEQRELSSHHTPPRELLMILHDAIAQHQTYPESALELNQKGTVTIKFLLHPNGQVTNLLIQHSSGIDSLDSAALNAVAAISPVANSQQFLQDAEYLSLDVVFQ